MLDPNAHLRLDLPDSPVPDRVSVVRKLEAGQRETFAALDGPGCIRHIWMATGYQPMDNRKAVLRIYFDDHDIPHVEAPLGDFFGAMHGLPWYPLNTPWLSIKEKSGYNAYFAMPFASAARIELEVEEGEQGLYLQCDWHRYPGQTMREPRRFCARWRREMPTERYGPDFVLLDADGPGQWLGFVYGVRLLDDADRWSHGGAENIYIDGGGERPAYIRGIGGEDTFGTSYGGALHTPETHLFSGMPYYVHEDVSQARPAQRLVGYRFFAPDMIPFAESIHARFGCMRNDICATSYWYQQAPPRAFVSLPAVAQRMPGVELVRGTVDHAPPATGQWWVCGPFAEADGEAMRRTLEPELRFEPGAAYEANHEPDSPWLNDGSRALGRDKARWVEVDAFHHFVDCNHLFRPVRRGVAPTHPGVAVARCKLLADQAGEARLRVAWDDALTLRVNGGEPIDLGTHAAFRWRELSVPVVEGENEVVLKLSNSVGSNRGGWAFTFQARDPSGSPMLPRR